MLWGLGISFYRRLSLLTVTSRDTNPGNTFVAMFFFDHRTEIFKALSDGPSLGIELSVQSRVIFAIDSFFIGQMFPCA